MGQLALLDTDHKGWAILSDCGHYRWALTREWDNAKEKIVFLMLNPSTADAEQDDPTIRKCIGYAKRWGYGGLIVLNLFAYRSTDPKKLPLANDPVGLENDEWIRGYCENRRVVCAWGCDGVLKGRDKRVLSLLAGVSHGGITCLAVSKDGHPKHPLYLRGDLQPIPYAPEIHP